METLRKWHPDEYERFTGETIPEGGSHVKDERAFMELHKGDLVAVSAQYSKDRPGFVEATATVGGLRDGLPGARRFLVPEEEYARRSPFGFVVDPSRHEEIAG